MRIIRKLNNQRLDNQRREIFYESIMTDLALMGIITKEQAKAVLGFEIADDLKLPKAYYEEV